MKSDAALRELAKNTRAYNLLPVALQGVLIADMVDELLLLRTVNSAMRKRVGNLRRAVRGLQKAYEYAMMKNSVKVLKKRLTETHQELDTMRELAEPQELEAAAAEDAPLVLTRGAAERLRARAERDEKEMPA